MNMPLKEYAARGLPLKDVPLIDAHVHLNSMGHWEAPPLSEQVAEMDRLGIDVAVISSALSIAGDVTRGNDDVETALRQYPGRLYGYCFVSGNYPETMADELERRFANPAFRGLKVYPVGTPYDHPRFDPAWNFARDRGLPVLAHTWAGDYNGLDRAARRFPEVMFLAAHTGSGFVYQPYIDTARQLPNFILDLTYSREHTNMIETIVEQANPEQIIWGSDAPCFSMSHQLGKILFARIPDDIKHKIVCHNAARLFRIPVPPTD